MIRVAVLFLIASICGCGKPDEKPKEDLVPRDMERLQGVWQVQGSIRGGTPVPGEESDRMSFTFKGDELFPSDSPQNSVKIKIDPHAKPPAIDLTDATGATKLGIYKFDGTTLRLCFDDPGQPRPKDFESRKDSKMIDYVLKRVIK
jgi:uncharacterized protein (TIGR03067 family)